MVSLMNIMSIQLVCLTIVVCVLLFHVARRTWVINQQQQQSDLRDKLIQQRDEVSRRLNNLQEQHQQAVCKLINRSSATSETGGWCDAAVLTVHVTDGGLAGALAKLFDGRSVIGMGDGRGEYRRLIIKSGHVTHYDAYDGAPNIYNITGGQNAVLFSDMYRFLDPFKDRRRSMKCESGRGQLHTEPHIRPISCHVTSLPWQKPEEELNKLLLTKVKFLDLTLPQYWLPRYDWVLSMEVLEHIKVQYETIVLDNIDRSAGYGAVLSWASPGQSGFYHVNNRPAEYLNKVMKKRGFRLDLKTSKKLRTISTLPWLKRNLMVFYRL